MAVEVNNFKMNEQTVRYYEDGIQHGRTILFLHGGIGDAGLNWKAIMPHFSSEYHVVAPDLPGFGGTDPLRDGKSLNDIVKWLLDFLKAQGIDQVVIIANGFGALIARLMATSYPQLVAAVVLINGGFIPDIPKWAQRLMGYPVIGKLFASLLARVSISGDGLKDMIHHQSLITEELRQNISSNTSGFASLMQMTATYPPSKTDKPMVAVMILWGTEDGSTSLAEGKKLKETLGSSDLIDIEGCGHLPHIEEPDIFEWQVKNFLSNHDPAKRSAIPGS